jgi:tripeptidyl-peptidase-1
MLYKAVVAAAIAAGVSAQRPLHESWKDTKRADASKSVRFTVGMKMRDYEGLEKKLLDISSPKSPNYGKWLKQEEILQHAATEPAIRRSVRRWATHTGAKCDDQVSALKCRGTVAQVEALLGAELREFAHIKTGKTVIKASESKPGEVPITLKDQVLIVSGLHQLPIPHLGNSRPVYFRSQTGEQDYAIVPQTLYSLYNRPTDDSNPISSAGPIEFQDYPAYDDSDNTIFATNVGLNAWVPVTANQTVGPFQEGEGLESTLDEQYIYAMGQNNNKWYWTENDWQYEFAQNIVAATSFPSVMSMSYAWYEGQQCVISPGVAPCNNQQTYAASLAFVIATNQLFATAVAKGITLTAASGDSGAHGRSDPDCSYPYTRATFPASSPWVTAVGATELWAGTTGNIPSAPVCASTLQCATGGYEIVASRKTLSFFDSGGGFSNMTLMPSWQQSVVSTYLQNTSALPPAGDFNTSGRGFPDVAALGHNYYIEAGGAVSSVDGTSAATPVFSGLIADINAVRQAAGKSVLGFVNPALYAAYAANPNTFNDVVQGDNQCTESSGCSATDDGGCTGYFAAPGWDATTGLGTPNYANLKAYLAALP